MSDDYLWNGSGEPDPQIQKLESTLGRLRLNRPVPEFPEITTLAPPVRRIRLLAVPLWPRWAAVVAAGLVIAAVGLVLLWPKPVTVARSHWDVTSIEGAPRVGGNMIAASGPRNIGLGQVLETDPSSRASLRDEDTGEIEVEPGTRLRMFAGKSGTKSLVLERGTIHATIWAPPGEFVVDTPSAVAVDLGCVYTLHVDDNGDGVLHTTLGWVGFKLAGHESFIPAGAACHTRKKTGPGTPYFEDASDALRGALSAFDREGAMQDERTAALQTVLAQARERDALTLWHLLARVAEGDRGRVYDKLSQLVPAPAGVTREGIVHLDARMLDLWWNELGLGDVALWRHWERAWSAQHGPSNVVPAQ